MAKREIMLTPEEVEEIKDEVAFRTKVILELKLLRGVKDRMIKIEVLHGVQWVILMAILSGLITKALKVW